MKKKLFLIAFSSFATLGIVSAQSTDTLVNNRQQAVDSISNIKTINQSEKEQLNKDYKQATDNLDENRAKQAIDSNRNNVKKVRRNANTNGVTPESRQRVEQGYKEEKRALKDSVNKQ